MQEMLYDRRGKYNLSANKENSEIHQMREEKLRLNNKLDEFTSILKNFQDNQNKYMDENNKLKQ